MEIDIILEKLNAFNFSHQEKLEIKKRGNGYSLYLKFNGRPIARVKLISNSNIYEVLWWSHRDKWESIGDFGGETFAIDGAIEFIDNDPLGCFW